MHGDHHKAIKSISLPDWRIMSWEQDNYVEGTRSYVVGTRSYVVGTRSYVVGTRSYVVGTR